MGFPYEKVTWLVGTLGALDYGHAIRIGRFEWRAAIPVADPMQQIMLSSAGHRPETERAPLDWVRFWMNGTQENDFMQVLHEPYKIDEDPMTGDLMVGLPVRYCPQCHGAGFVTKRPLSWTPELVGSADIAEAVEVKIERVCCDHKKQKGDPLRRSWP